MKCPSCGAENPEGAEYCSLCMQSIQGPEAGVTSPQSGEVTAQTTYSAPSEWRGEEKVLRPVASKSVESRIRSYYWKLVIYGAIILAVIAWLVLSLTVWGTVSPEKRSTRLMEAINARDLGGFLDNFMQQDRSAAEDLYDEVVAYLGSSGSYEDISLDVDEGDVYTARAYATGGVIHSASGSENLDSSSRLCIMLENHNGVWYVDASDTILLP
jgi:hypothetical protein